MLKGQKTSKISKKYSKFVTVLLFGTMAENFRKIIRIVFELRALVWGWDMNGRHVVPQQVFSF